MLDSAGNLGQVLNNDIIELTNASAPRCPTNVVVQFDRGDHVERRRRDWTRVPASKYPPNINIDDLLQKHWPLVEPVASTVTKRRLWVAGALSKFVLETVRDFPAKRIAVIVGSHGDAVRDENSHESVEDGVRALGPQRTPLLNRDLGTELRTIAADLSKESGLVFVGFDACQMASIEAQYEVSSAHILDSIRVVASEDNQGGPGWFYDSIFTRWRDNGAQDGLAEAVLAHTDDAWPKWSEDHRLFATLSEMRASPIETELAVAVDSLGEILAADAAAIAGEGVIVSVQRARCACRRFPGNRYEEAPSVDLECLADTLATDVTLSATAVSRAKRVVELLDSRVVVRTRSESPYSDPARGARGLSIYLPPVGTALSSAYDKESQTKQPRFVRREDGRLGGWAAWVAYWSKRPRRLCDHP